MLEYVGFHVEHTPTTCPYDFVLRREGQPYAVVEYKHRQSPLRDPYFIDVRKMRDLIDAASDMGVKPILMIEGPATPYFWMYGSLDYPVGRFKRTKGNRGDAVHDVLEIPLTAFKKL